MMVVAHVCAAVRRHDDDGGGDGSRWRWCGGDGARNARSRNRPASTTPIACALLSVHTRWHADPLVHIPYRLCMKRVLRGGAHSRKKEMQTACTAEHAVHCVSPHAEHQRRPSWETHLRYASRSLLVRDRRASKHQHQHQHQTISIVRFAEICVV